MDPELIVTKLKSYSHQEYNTDEYKDLDHIKNCINSGKDIFNRNGENLVPADLTFIPKYSNLLPEYMR
jgi:hypothetical protein